MATSRPTVLLLANAAAFSRTFFEALAPHLDERGIDVEFAFNSHLSDIMYANGEALQNAWYFTDFCASEGPLPPEELVNHENRWTSLFSDFDRLLTIGIPVPLGVNDRLSYAQIPILLEKFFDRIFAAVRPVAVVYEQASNSFALAANKIATRRGVPFLSIAPGRMAGRLEVSPTGALRDYVTIGKICDQIKREGADPEDRAIAENYIRTVVDQVPDYMRAGGDGEMLSRTGLWSKYVKFEKLRHILRGVRYRLKQPGDVRMAYMHGDPLTISLSLFRRAFKRRLRVSRVARLYRAGTGDGEYLLYPLHFHPEASTSVLAPDFIDEMSVIKAIAFRLPVHVKLAVKEHPSAVALQSLDFYRQLAALPNVILIGPDNNAKELARKAVGVICVTSTLGFEAAALNKPVITLGDVLYGYFPNVRRISHFGDLRAALDWAMAYQPIDPEEIATAMTAYVAFTDPGTFSFRESAGDTKALQNIADIILSRIGNPGSVMSSNHSASYDE